MRKVLSIAHLTGTAQVVSNELTHDLIIPDSRPAFTLGQMFFKPYESEKEFIFCARNTLTPLLIAGFTAWHPIFAITYPVTMMALGLTAMGVGFIISACGDNITAKLCFDLTEQTVCEFFQIMINLLLLPLTAITMMTRGISTGLKAAGVCDYDALQPAPSV